MSHFSSPPAEVPTLTDVVVEGNTSSLDHLQELQALQELMVRRVLNQAGPLLEKRLNDTCERLVRAHVQVLLPSLMDEIGQVVRDSVRQGFESGQAGQQGTGR